MVHLIPLYRKELRSYFATPTGSVLVVGSAVLFGLIVYAAADDPLRRSLMGPIFVLTGFSPSSELIQQPVILVVGLARLLALFLIPMVAMRLFPEEKQSRTMELLLTSPVSEIEIVLAKWLGGFSLYILIIGASLIEVVLFSRWLRLEWRMVFNTYAALAFSGAGLLAVGEFVSTTTRHQSVAAWTTFGACIAVMGLFNKGVLHLLSIVGFSAMLLLGWLSAFRSVRAFRESS